MLSKKEMMNYKHNHYTDRHLEIEAFAEEIKLGLQVCGELLVESKHIILGALAWKGWIENGRCLIVINLPDPNEFARKIELPMGIMLQDDPDLKILGAEELVEQYDPDSEGVLVVCHWDKLYCAASACIFTPGYPPQICYEEVMNRPEEFDFCWLDDRLFDDKFAY